jgi:PucR-like helix-turn-helix protein
VTDETTAGRTGPDFGLVVAGDVDAATTLLDRNGLQLAHPVPPRVPTVQHLVVSIASLPDRHTLGRLATTEGWLVLLTPESAYRRAATLLVLATRLPTSRRMLCVDELLVYQVLAATGEDEQEAVVRDVLGPVLCLPDPLAGRLLTTLEALHWNEGSAKSTAHALGLHSKTVLNRLRRFEDLTGLCLNRPSDRLRVDVAVYLLRLRGRLGRTPAVRPMAAASASV